MGAALGETIFMPTKKGKPRYAKVLTLSNPSTGQLSSSCTPYAEKHLEGVWNMREELHGELEVGKYANQTVSVMGISALTNGISLIHTDILPRPYNSLHQTTGMPFARETRATSMKLPIFASLEVPSPRSKLQQMQAWSVNK